jgi:hypothetical protein
MFNGQTQFELTKHRLSEQRRTTERRRLARLALAGSQPRRMPGIKWLTRIASLFL